MRDGATDTLLETDPAAVDRTEESFDAIAETPAEQDERPIPLPSPLEDAPRGSFPWLMMLTPAVMGGGLAFMTGSTMPLLFAALGPGLALGGVIDQSVQRRARARDADARFDEALATARAAIEARRRRELARRLLARPTVERILAGATGPLAVDTAAPGDAAPTIALGTTTVPSGIRIDAAASITDRRLQALVDRGRMLEGVPLVAPVRRLVIAGPAVLTVPAALAIIVDAATANPSGLDVALEGASARRRIAREIVGSRLHADRAVTLRTERRDGDPVHPPADMSTRLSIVVVDWVAAAPADADAVLELTGERDGVVRLGDRTVRVVPQAATPTAFRSWAARHLAARRRQGIGVSTVDRLPDTVPLDDLLRTPPPSRLLGDGHHLAAPIGAGNDTAAWIDLVADGPHAIVGGTTGTGKSELLRSWIAALAARYPATYVSILCVDFKGGATFDAIADLPHCVGVVTDLDDGEAVRVLAGLQAELRRREIELRDRGVRDIGALPPGVLGRLVVVVDEFQALLDTHAELHDAFADLAARGRSLGIHLVLCAQRPAGAARDSLLANCTVRISLRVTNPADSHAVIGTAGAASLPSEPRGRALVATGGAPRTVQIAVVDEPFVSATAVRRELELRDSGLTRPPAPWMPPLPLRLEEESAARRLGPARGSRVPIALLDDPARQAQPTFDLDVRGGDHLLCIGPSGSGKSTALSSIERAVDAAGVARIVRIPRGVEASWDALAAVRGERDPGPLVLLVDDLDERGAGFDEEHRLAWFAALADLARLGGVRRLTLVATTTRIAGDAATFLGLARDIVRLGSPPRHEFVMSGGEVGDYRSGLPPGRGVVRGLLAQMPFVADPPRESAAAAAAPVDLAALASGGTAIVTRHPIVRTRQLTASGLAVVPPPKPGMVASERRPGEVVLGEPEAWQQSFGALARAAARGPVVIDDVPAPLLRAVLPGEPLPPPVADTSRTVLVRDPDGSMRRLEWPRAAATGG